MVYWFCQCCRQIRTHAKVRSVERQPLLAAVTSSLKPVTVIKFSTSVKHSHKPTLVSAETSSHWCLSSLGEAGVCPRSPLPSLFIPCDLTKTKGRADLSFTMKNKDNLSWEVAKAAFPFQLNLGPISSSSNPWLQGRRKQHCSQLRDGKGFLRCPAKRQETKKSCSLALIVLGQHQTQDWQVAPAHSCDSPFSPFCTLKLMSAFWPGILNRKLAAHSFSSEI